MLPDDDKRHGTSAGYIAGCRDQCCWRAKQRYDKRRRSELFSTGVYRTCSSVGSIRRIQALQAIGWSVPQIAKRMGCHHQHLYNLNRHPSVYTSTAAAIADVYEVMAMTLPPESTTGERISCARARNHARRMGWPPPLAWDDIDNDPEPASVETEENHEDTIDHVVVQRVVESNQRTRKLTRTEAAEVVRLLLQRGLSTYRIENDYGLKVDRYWKASA